mgnify:CR=1 FL=1
MFLGATLLWIVGLVTIVPYGTYYLLFHAERDRYALLITPVLFWNFGYWGSRGPGVHRRHGPQRIPRARERACRGKLREALQSARNRP